MLNPLMMKTVMKKEMDEEDTNEEEEVDKLYRDVNASLEGRDTEMTVNNRVLLYVPVTAIAETPLLSATTLPPPPIPLILHPQQTPIPTPITIPSIVDAYLTNKMHDIVKTAVQLQFDRLRDEAQAENADFINKLDDNIKKIIKDQVLTRSSNESKTSHVVAANLSELELKKILIDKMENTVSFKRCCDDEDKDEEPSVASNQGSKRRRAGKEPESTSAPNEKTSKTTGKSTEGSKSHHKSAGESAQAKEPMHTAKDLEDPAHLEFETGVTEDQPDKETS
ncbi:hypothetical protein Tco_0762474 [Tanacetum coccineum]